MGSAKRTSPGGPIDAAAVAQKTAEQPASIDVHYAMTRIAAEADVDIRTATAALSERDYTRNRQRARVLRAIEALGWDRAQLEHDARNYVTRKG